MSPLVYLITRKTWGVIRGWYRKPLSAILTSLALLFVIGLLVGLVLSPNRSDMVDFSIVAILLTGVLVGIFTFSLISKNKALVYQNDASFVLAGPFTKKQVLGYVLMNDVTQNIWMTLIFSGYILIFSRGAIGSIGNFLLVFFAIFLFSGVMLICTSYDYVLEKGFAKYSGIKKVGLAFVVGGFLLFAYTIAMSNGIDLSTPFNLFSNEQLQWYPVFGWFLGILYHGFMGETIMFFLYTVLLLLVGGLIGWLFFNTKIDFYEAAMMDSERIQVIVDKAKSGNTADIAMMNTKIRKKQGKFSSGALAIWSSYVLQMRKSNQFIKIGDFIFFVMYTTIAYFTGSLETYIVMLSLVVFISINSDAITYELKRPFVYLIPDSSFKKMMVLILPMMYRMVIITLLGGVMTMVLFEQSLINALFFVLTLWGIALVLIAGSVFTLKVLKGNKNPFVEQLMRMLIITLALVPSILLVVGLTLTLLPLDSPNWLMSVSLVVLIINSVLSLGIIRLSSTMLQGSDMFV